MGKRKISFWMFGFVLLMLALPEGAKTDTVFIDGSVAFWNNGYGIPPYGGTLNGQQQQFFYVDFSTPI